MVNKHAFETISIVIFPHKTSNPAILNIKACAHRKDINILTYGHPLQKEFSKNLTKVVLKLFGTQLTFNIRLEQVRFLKCRSQINKLVWCNSPVVPICKHTACSLVDVACKDKSTLLPSASVVTER